PTSLLHLDAEFILILSVYCKVVDFYYLFVSSFILLFRIIFFNYRQRPRASGV
ncbi:MAG: hypothetical protein ACI9RM_002060, partial [Ulvibacter sp.]